MTNFVEEFDYTKPIIRRKHVKQQKTRINDQVTLKESTRYQSLPKLKQPITMLPGIVDINI